MRTLKEFFMRHMVAAPISISAWIFMLAGTNLGFWASTGLFAGIYLASSTTVKQVQISSAMKKYGLTRSEYRYIDQQLKEAKNKIKRLSSYYGKVRSVQAFRQLHEMSLMARKVLNVVKTNPQRFYYTENFFYAHLDSAVELTSKYALLVNQPLKDNDVQNAINNTRNALDEVNEQLQFDLRQAISNDMETLKIEIDYVDSTSKRRKQLMEGDQQHDGNK